MSIFCYFKWTLCHWKFYTSKIKETWLCDKDASEDYASLFLSFVCLVTNGCTLWSSSRKDHSTCYSEWERAPLGCVCVFMWTLMSLLVLRAPPTGRPPLIQMTTVRQITSTFTFSTHAEHGIWDWSPSNPTPLASGMSCGDRTQAVFEHVGPADLRRIRTCSNKTNVAFRSPGAQRHLTNESMLKQMKEVPFTAA